MTENLTTPIQNQRPIDTIITDQILSNDPNFGQPEIDAPYRKQGYIRSPYHYIVKVDGTIQYGRSEAYAGVVSHPKAATSINIVSVIGPDGKYTGEQRKAVDDLVFLLKKRYQKAELSAEV